MSAARKARTHATTGRSTDRSTDHSADRSTDHSADRSTDHSADRSTDHSADRSTDHSADRSTDHSADRSTDHSADRSTDHSTDRGDAYERLLRWYPRPWRQAHGTVLVSTLREADAEAGRTRPSRADTRLLRVHGIAAHLSPAAGWVLATAGAAASLAVLLIIFTLLGRSMAPAMTGTELLATPASLVQLLATAAAPALVSLAAVAFLRATRVLSDPAAVLAGALSVLAWSMASLTSASWGVGFERADAGLAPTPFSAATWPLFLAAASVGAASAAVVWDGVLSVAPALRDDPRRARAGTGPRAAVRRGLAVVLGAPTAVFLGLGAVAPGSGFVAGAGVAVACLLLTRSTSTTQKAPGSHQVVSAVSPLAAATTTTTENSAPRTPRPRRPLVADGRRAAAAGQLAVVALVVGSAATVYGLWGSAWRAALVGAEVPLATLPPMNLALVVGSGAGVLVVAAVALLTGEVLVSRWGRWAWLAVGGVVVSLVARAVAAAMGPAGDAGTYTLFGGALLLGLVLAAPLARLLPGRSALRWSTTVVCGVAVGLSAGVGVLALAPLLSPLAAGAVVVALLVSARRARRTGQGDQLARVQTTARA